MAYFSARAARPVVGALGAAVVPFVPFDSRRPAACEAKPFNQATCVKNEKHTHDTRKITFSLGAPWTTQGAIANVLVRVQTGGKAETGCCACCSCPPPCGCPKQANGCCACCKCDGTCGCPKKEAPAPKKAAAEGCCACCKCPPPCGCPKQANGCCACCSCPDKCGCPKKEAPSSAKAARPYNPLSVESGSELTLLVKRYPEGKVGGALHELKPGESVEIRGPNTQWKFEEGKYNQYAMVAGGTGITPLFQTAGCVLSKDPAAQVTMVTLNKTSDDVLLRAELAELQATHGKRLKVIHVTECAEGRASAAMLKKLLPAPKGKVWETPIASRT